jgi:cytidylate kinase
MPVPVVAIDGPAGSGKSTVAAGVASALGLPVLDTGAMYRAVTLAALESGVALDDADRCTEVAEKIDITVEGRTTTVGGRDVSAAIRGPDVTAAVSQVSAHPGVRRVLVERQRAWVAANGGGVVEGRDIGTVVFPDATVKVYLEADDEERARRRQRDEQAAARDVAVDAVRDALVKRDEYDRGRVASPLRTAEDALVIDTTAVSADDVIAQVVAAFRAATAR